MLAIVIASSVVAAAVLVPRARRAAPDPLARISPAVAAESLEALVGRQRLYEAIPYVRRLEREQTQASADFEGNFASILSNATIQVRSQDGMAIPATRSTPERVAFMREAFRRLDRAEQLAASDGERGNVVVTRARMLSIWGFQREAYFEYRHANQLRALDAREHGEAAWLEQMLDHPSASAGANPADAGATAR